MDEDIGEAVVIDHIPEDGFNSQDFLDMSNHLKLIYDRDKIKLDAYIKKYNHFYEQLMIIYGLIKCYQTNDHDYNYDICLREIDTICSTILLNHLEDTDDL
tara:strand:- start:98 stop:400 length:303 start_codon:yes stop_codon:yes gene_type:complete